MTGSADAAPRRFPVPLLATVALAVAACALAFLRGGLLAWLGMGLALGLIVKQLMWPGARDLRLVAFACAAWALSWALVLGGVYWLWESAEVVQLRFRDPGSGVAHEARVWVVDGEGGPAMVWDGNRSAIQVLAMAGAVELERAGETSTWRPVVQLAQSAPEEYRDGIYLRLVEKYGKLVQATTAFYLFAGRAPGRDVALIRLEAMDAR